MSAGTSTAEKPTAKRKTTNKGNRFKRSNFPKQRVIALSEVGLSDSSIAKVVDYNQSTITRFLQRMAPEIASVKSFKAERASIFASIQAQSLDIQQRVLKSLDVDEHVLAALPTKEKAMILDATNRIAGTIYDKERLEEGKSTSNVGVIHRMMGDAFSGSHKDTTDSGTPEPVTLDMSRT